MRTQEDKSSINPEAGRDGFLESFLVFMNRFQGWVCVLTGYFDETHTHTDDPITGVAGFVFRKDQLASLEREWIKRTDQLLEPFRAAECNAQRGQFSRWPQGDCQQLMADLAKLIAAHRGPGFVCTVENKAFEAWGKKAPANKPWLGNPYSICLLYVVGMVRHYLREMNLDDDVFYIFESGANGRKEAEDFLRRIQTRPDLREDYQLNGYTFLPKDAQNAALLGSADYLVWEWQRNYRESEDAEMRGDADPGWTDRFKLFFNPDSPPVRYFHISENDFQALALKIAIRQLHVD